MKYDPEQNLKEDFLANIPHRLIFFWQTYDLEILILILCAI